MQQGIASAISRTSRALLLSPVQAGVVELVVRTRAPDEVRASWPAVKSPSLCAKRGNRVHHKRALERRSP
jgi:hypothetical protein